MHPRPSAAVWLAVHNERQSLIEDLESLTAEQWARPSLCGGWDIHDVVAHFVNRAKTIRLGFVGQMIAARFDFDTTTAQGVPRERAATPEVTLAEFRRICEATKTPPASLVTRLVEAIVHGEDIRRPLGITGSYPSESIKPTLQYRLKTSASLGGGKERAAGFRLQASDLEFSHGSGPEVQGTSLELLMALSGRPIHRADFSGEGVPSFLRKLGQPPR